MAAFVMPMKRSYMSADKKLKRPDQNGTHRAQFEKNKAKILATREVCGICGRPVDKSLRWPHPLSPTVDHIIPINKGGHPSDLSNLQLAHWNPESGKSSKKPKASKFFAKKAKTAGSQKRPKKAQENRLKNSSRENNVKNFFRGTLRTRGGDTSRAGGRGPTVFTKISRKQKFRRGEK